MKLYVATWPNGTISILTAQNKKDLFFKLDSEGNPEYVKVKQYTFPTEDDIYLTTNFKEDENRNVVLTKGNPTIYVDVNGDYSSPDVKVKKVKL